MSDALRLALAFGIAAGVTSAAVPIAIRLACRTDFLDCPAGYKQHRGPTPYLGGLAVVVALLAAAIPLAHGLEGFWVLVPCLVGMLAMGTLDDRIGLPLWPRVAMEIVVAAALYAVGLGW